MAICLALSAPAISSMSSRQILVLGAMAIILFTGLNHILIRMQNTDFLTGIPNRALFEQLVAKNGKIRRNWHSVFMLDVDDFKHFNDDHGHEYGDHVLNLVGQQLSELIMRYGVVARYGGDEFVGVLRVQPAQAKKILDQLNSRIAKADPEAGVHVSVGISEIKAGLSYEELLKSADKALYMAKRNGKGQTIVNS